MMKIKLNLARHSDTIENGKFSATYIMWICTNTFVEVDDSDVGPLGCVWFGVNKVGGRRGEESQYFKIKCVCFNF
jgi:hypothetical protein